MSVRVRFAPSPTGYLHIGGLRTALYNYLFARHHGGTFVLRVEDTDQTRFVEDSVEDIVTSLKWAGVEIDESPQVGGEFGPYVQSERTELYRKYAQELLEKGAAYYAFDTAEELDAMRTRQQNAGIAPRYDRSSMRNQFTLGEEETKRLLSEGALHVIRLKVPITGDIHFKDIIRGNVVVPARDVDDQILLKSDGFPTYHLANVVDDHTMQITHVIRGEEWLPSTPKHVLLYQGFGWEPPQFAHLSLLLNIDRKKLSKRDGSVSVREYINKGYFRDALINFVSLLGWNPSGEREVFTLDELIKEFELSKVNKAGAIFDFQKLDWMNGQYMNMKVENEMPSLVDELRPLLESKGFSGFSNEYIASVIKLTHERITFLKDIPDFAPYMFGVLEVDQEFKTQIWNEQTPTLHSKLQSAIEEIPESEFNHTIINETVKSVIKEVGVKMKDAVLLLRLLVTGRSVGAGMFETMEILGKETCMKRINA